MNIENNQIENWQSQEGPRKTLCKFAGTMFKLYKKQVKVHSQGHMFKIYGTNGKVWTLWTYMPNMNTQSLTGTIRKLLPKFKSR